MLSGQPLRDIRVVELGQAGVPCAPIHSASEALAHPQVQALGMVEEGGAGAMPRVRLPLSFDGVRPAAGAPAPALGAYDKTREKNGHRPDQDER